MSLTSPLPCPAQLNVLSVSQLKVFFPQTTVAKPKSSRNSSVGEASQQPKSSKSFGCGCRPDCLLLPYRGVCGVRALHAARRFPAFPASRLVAPSRRSLPRRRADSSQQTARAVSGMRRPLRCHGRDGSSAGELCSQTVPVHPQAKWHIHCTGWDADQSYDLPEGDEPYECLPPVQLPTAPAYKSALIEAQRGYVHRYQT